MPQDRLGLLMLVIKRPVRIDVHVEKPKFVFAKIYRYTHRQARPPGAIMPRQINPRNIGKWYLT